MGARVSAPDGAVLGRVREVAMSPQDDAQHVSALIVRTANGDRLLSPGKVQSISRDAVVATGGDPEQWPHLVSSEGMLLLDRDLLDQQIIDINGRKVVRVNDASLIPEAGELGMQVKVGDVEIGTRGAVRRLLKGVAPRAAVHAFSERFAPKSIPWGFVNLIETDPSRRVRLKIDQERLEKLHPADIADILEELAPAEREAIFSGLDEEVAAET
ncbi:MAG: magnesium transporter, partial [Acidobacteriales bacterium]|nr:magnesium transporter [Terriglobales bacterium]